MVLRLSSCPDPITALRPPASQAQRGITLSVQLAYATAVLLRLTVMLCLWVLCCCLHAGNHNSSSKSQMLLPG